jgi:hypothetical protein
MLPGRKLTAFKFAEIPDISLKARDDADASADKSSLARKSILPSVKSYCKAL